MKLNRRILALPGILLGIFIAVPAALADILIGPAAISGATLPADGGGSLINTINQTGLSVAYTSGVTGFESYVATATHDAPGPGNAFSSGVGNLPGTIDYDLGASYRITQLALWTSFDGFSINGFTVFTSADGVSFSSAGAFSAVDTAPPMAAQVFDLSDSDGRYVRLEITSGHGAGFVNLSEIVVGAAPVPQTLALLGMALAGLGWSRRRT